MALKVGTIELHMGPDKSGAPDNLNRVIINFIKGAKKTLFIAVRELDDSGISDAIIDARKRKVRVKIVIEGSCLTVDRAVTDPFVPGGTNESNMRWRS